MRRATTILASLALIPVLAGCAAESIYASEEEVARASYNPGGEPTVTLLTMILNETGRGGHSALLIDGPNERVLFDPAGSWHHPLVPERNDVLYGMSPVFFDFYMDYHARETVDVYVHEVTVSPEVAQSLIAAVEDYGAVPPARCSLSVSTVLSQTPGFEAVSRAWFPTRVMADFEQIAGVRESLVVDDDSDDNLELLQAQAATAARVRLAEELAGE